MLLRGIEFEICFYVQEGLAKYLEHSQGTHMWFETEKTTITKNILTDLALFQFPALIF